MLLPVIKKQIRKFINAKFIVTLIFSKWVANHVPVRKNNGEIWICIAFININNISLKDNNPFPNMEHILQKVVGSEMISTMDGFSGYNQIKVLPEDQEKTSFTTPWGTFMYSKIPFGLMNGRATF